MIVKYSSIHDGIRVYCIYAEKRLDLNANLKRIFLNDKKNVSSMCGYCIIILQLEDYIVMCAMVSLAFYGKDRTPLNQLLSTRIIRIYFVKPNDNVVDPLIR